MSVCVRSVVSHECTFILSSYLQLHSLATSVAKEAPLKERLSSESGKLPGDHSGLQMHIG